MTTHKIKLSHCFFDDVASGRKNFELRKNDRHYQVGDYLCLCEVKEAKLTGRKVLVTIMYKLQGYTGLSDDYCILGITTKND
ncbi:ASCH/PUA domain-containing protein [Streptococcus mutans]|uniref:ASCH/PUA domain-containing protein n=1 Tax=Streptococcus mutans TaxID=1309 RepID=UPI0038B6FB3E